MNKADKYRDIATGLFFMGGVLGFVSGAFIISTTLLGAASVLSNLNFAERIDVWFMLDLLVLSRI